MLSSDVRTGAPAGLVPGEVRLQLWDLDGDAGDGAEGQRVLASETVLSGAERAAAARLVSGPVRDRYVAAHVQLRRVLGAALGTDPRAVDIERQPCTLCGEPHGKPTLGGPASPAGQLSFNLSHSGPLAVLALGRGVEVGVDIEPVDHALDADAITTTFLSPVEAQAIRALRGPDRRLVTLAHWVRKEALLKGTGEGLNHDPRTLSLPVGPPDGETVRRVRHAGAEWQIHDIPAPQVCLALAVHPAPSGVRLADLRPGA